MGSSKAAGVCIAAPAKLNLHLGIYPGRDERGYHRADSVMIALSLADMVSVRPAEAASIRMSDEGVVSQEHNTAFIALRRLAQALGQGDAYSIYIEKRIPPQSGLGGASSDAAAVILALCELWGISPRNERVVACARSIGADVPFFLTLRPALLVGAGDVLEREFAPLAGVPMVLVRPNAGVSTVEAYRSFDEQPTEPLSPEGMCEALVAQDVARVAEKLYNNLAPAAARITPETEAVRSWLAQQEGVRAAMLTGSGSCVFAICTSEEAAKRIASLAQESHNWWASAALTVGSREDIC